MADIRINNKIIELPIDAVKVYEGSHKTDAVVGVMKQSLEEFGFQQPIIIDSNNVIVAGNALFKAAKELGKVKVPCLRTDYLTEEQIQQYRIADNKTSEFARWNEKKLRKELSYLGSPQSLQYCFDENILSMLGMDQKPKPQHTQSAAVVVPQQGGKKPKVLTEAEKDARFKEEMRSVDQSLQAKPAEYYEYHCSKCGKLVKIKK